MSSTLAGSKFPCFSHFIGKSYGIALNQSIEALLSSLKIPSSQNPSNFASEFLEFVNCKADPSLESIWIYAALNFTHHSSQKSEPLTRLSDIKDLFQLVFSFSVSCNSIKCIALIAPVIFNLHKCIVDLSGFQLEFKKERKVSGEIKCLVDSVLGYISVCCNAFDQERDELEGLIKPLFELISVWLVDNGMQSNDVEYLRVFFPLLSDDVSKRACVEGFGIIDLAGFVVVEAFMLKLCWKLREEGFGESTQNELRSWIVGSVSGLRSSYFYVILLSMLLDSVLPISSLVNFECESGLRKVLFDSLVLVEYSFLTPKSLSKLPARQIKRVILTRLMASHEAIEFFSKLGDETKRAAYLNAFANSSLPSLTVKWIRNELGNELSFGEPMVSSPREYLRWILNIENRGIKLFDDDMSKFRSAFNSKDEQLENAEGKKPDSDLLFYIDNQGQEEHVSEEDEKTSERMSAAFMAAAHSIQSSKQGERKQMTKSSEKRKKVKFVKYNGQSSVSDEKSMVSRGDNSSSESDIENPTSDEDMEMGV